MPSQRRTRAARPRATSRRPRAAPAWEQARAALILDWPPASPPLYGNRYAVLVTAGSPNVNRDGCTWGSAKPDTCTEAWVTEEEYDFFIAQVQRLGIPSRVRTFVIGLPGSENPRGASFDPLFMLSRFAAAGGGADAGCVPGEGLVEACDASTCLAQRGQVITGRAEPIGCLDGLPQRRLTDANPLRMARARETLSMSASVLRIICYEFSKTAGTPIASASAAVPKRVIGVAPTTRISRIRLRKG